MAAKLKKAAPKNKRKSNSKKESWSLYIVECCNGAYYTGIAKDVDARIKKHNDGKGAAYTRAHRPVKLIYQETCANRPSALIREWEVKSLSRKKKEALVKGNRIFSGRSRPNV